MRIYDFEKILNFRDFGNYPTRSGGHIKTGRLFRSAHFHQPSPVDLTRLDSLNIGLISDLRSEAERGRQPNAWPGERSVRQLQFQDLSGYQPEGLAPHEAFMKEELKVPQDSRDYMQRSYKARPADAGYRDIFSKTLKFMAETGEPIVIHCAAGKDRTGTLAAIILGALDVDPNIVMEDYMLTMQAVNIDPFLAPAAKHMETRFGREYDPESLRPMFGVEPAFLEKSLETIGDMDRYIREALEISDKEKAAIQAAYLT